VTQSSINVASKICCRKTGNVKAGFHLESLTTVVRSVMFATILLKINAALACMLILLLIFVYNLIRASGMILIVVVNIYHNQSH